MQGQGITFSFDNGLATRTLDLRLSPYNVSWTYNVNTSVTDTYTGQVVQVLSVNIDRLVIEGQFGKEGAFGKKVAGGKLIKRSGSEQFEYGGDYPGLYSMTEFFREFFSVASQGGDTPGVSPDARRFIQTPMTVTYEAGSSTKTWKITPMSFPSFRRTNEDFAPEWRVESYVIEADSTIAKSQSQQVIASINRLRGGIGYKVANPFSDPAAGDATTMDTAETLVKGFRKLLPTYTVDELRRLVWNRVSAPNAAKEALGFDPNQVADQINKDIIDGEVRSIGDVVGDVSGNAGRPPT